MAVMINREAPKSGLASLMAMKGREGDSELVHMSPSEVQSLQALGKLTVNPDTGLPEAFSLKSILPIAANIGLGVATGGLSLPAQMAIMGAANVGMGLVQGQDMDEALFGGALAAGTAGIGGALGGSAATNAATKAVTPATGAALNTGASQLGAGAALDIGSAGFDDAISGGLEAASLSEAANLGSVSLPPINAGSLPTATPLNIKQPTTMTGDFLGAAEKADGIVGRGIDFLGGDASKMANTEFTIGGKGTGDLLGGRNISQLEAADKAVKTGIGSLAMEALKPEEYEPLPVNFKAPAQSSYGTREAEFVKQNYLPEGLTAAEVQAAIEGEGDPLQFFQPVTQTAPTGLNYGGVSTVKGSPTQMGNPAVGAGYAKTGGHLEDLFYASGGDINMFSGLVTDGGDGDGMSDNVEFDVVGDEKVSKAMLSPDEYVIDAHTVAALGNGSTNKGADRLDKFVKNVRTKSYDKGKQPKQNAGLEELVKLHS